MPCLRRRLPVVLSLLALTAGLSAAETPVAGAETGLVLVVPAEQVLEPASAIALHLSAENRGDTELGAQVHWTLQSNAQFVDRVMPDPLLGSDLARGKPSTITIDGQDRGDARLTDGDDASAFETEWGSQAKELVATIDLSSPRSLRAVKYLAGDANWIFRADVSTSLDGVTFTPVASSQQVDLNGRWGGPHAFPWPATLSARYLRIRFYSPDKIADCVRLPVTIQAFDGIDEETITVPTVGTTIASGTLAAKVPARGAADLALSDRAPLKTGSYLLGMTYENHGKPVVRWSRLLVRPADTVDQRRARRFGINGSQVELAPELQRCGFGWMRFENGKWQMYSPSRDRVAFDGSVAPWNVPLDTVFRSYLDHGMQVQPYVFQTPEWATKAAPDMTRNRAGYPPKDPADYGEAIYQLVARYGTRKVDPQTLASTDKQTGLGLIQAVELWNEPNLVGPDWAPFVGPLSEYFTVLRAGIEGARRADPTLPVSAAGWAGIDLDIVGTLAEHRYADGKTPLDLIDIINVHFYSGKQEPETCGWDPNVQRNGPTSDGTMYPEQLDDLVAWRDRLKPGAEIWLGETGNDVGGPMGRTERHQAAKVPRAIMMALAAGIERVFIYREKGSTPTQHAGAGLLRDDGTIRAQWFTVATMIRQLQGFSGRALRLPSADPSIWMLLWQDGERRVITAWTTTNDAEVDIKAGVKAVQKLGLELGPATVTDAFGCTSTVTATATMPLGYFPTYLSVQASPQLDRAVKAARARDDLRSAERQRMAQVQLALFDFGPAVRLGVKRGYGAPRRYTAIGKDTLWNDRSGFGFLTAAAAEENQHWIEDPLEGDFCRVSPETAFRFRLPSGSHRLRVSATDMNGKGIAVAITGAQGPWSTTTGVHGHAELIVIGGDQPLEMRLGGWGQLRWLTAVPKD